MQLSKRLLTVASFVTPKNRLADVGTDHAYLPIYLIKEKKIPSAIALDVNQGPLMRAKEHILDNDLHHYIETRLSDGLAALLPGETDTVLIAGMGGALTVKILSEGQKMLKTVKELVLQPQSEICAVRQYLAETNWSIVREEGIYEDGKFYFPMKAIKKECASEKRCIEEVKFIELRYGKLLLENKDAVLKQFLLKEKNKYEKIQKHLDKQVGKISNELFLIQKALDYFESNDTYSV